MMVADAFNVILPCQYFICLFPVCRGKLLVETRSNTDSVAVSDRLGFTRDGEKDAMLILAQGKREIKLSEPG